MKDLEYKTKVEYGVALVILLIGFFFMYQASTIKASSEAVGPRTMPMFLAIAFILGGIWVGIRAFRGAAGEIKDGYGFQESNLTRIFEVIGCGIFFVFMFWGFGYFTAIFATFVAMLYTFGSRNWLYMILGGIVLAYVFQWLFMGVMLLFDPAGAIIDMRPYTNWITGAQ